jgi:hypothetical protein
MKQAPLLNIIEFNGITYGCQANILGGYLQQNLIILDPIAPHNIFGYTAKWMISKEQLVLNTVRAKRKGKYIGVKQLLHASASPIAHWFSGTIQLFRVNRHHLPLPYKTPIEVLTIENGKVVNVENAEVF